MKLLHLPILLLLAITLSSCNDGELFTPAPKKVKFTLSKKMVEIVFVMDNSGSMADEQLKMAQAFPSIVSYMDLQNLDYRIAITTTDVRTENQAYIFKYNSAKRGDFIKFSDGSYYLTPKSENIESLFSAAIQRPESRDDSNPGSDDERGIYAANLSIMNNQKTGFFRKGSHIAWVFVSDEDVRSTGIWSSYFGVNLPEALDYPATLVENISKYVSPNNTTSAHAIVIRPNQYSSTGQNQCFNLQNSQANRRAAYGYFYLYMTNPNHNPLRSDLRNKTYAQIFGDRLLPGTTGSICDSSYSQSLGSMVQTINQAAAYGNQNKTVYELPCRHLRDTLTFDHKPQNLQVDLINEGSSVRLSRPLTNTEYLDAELECEQI